TVLATIRASSSLTDQEARDHLARFLFRGEEVDRVVGVLSGGERARLALARLSLRQANLLVLDEPTNHLDLAAREQLERVLDTFGGTLLFVSHDRYFIDKLATELWLIDGGLLRRWEGNWSSYQRERAAGREATVVEYEQDATGSADERGRGRNRREPRRIGDEHAALERSLGALYDEWAKASEDAAKTEE